MGIVIVPHVSIVCAGCYHASRKSTIYNGRIAFSSLEEIDPTLPLSVFTDETTRDLLIDHLKNAHPDWKKTDMESPTPLDGMVVLEGDSPIAMISIHYFLSTGIVDVIDPELMAKIERGLPPILDGLERE